jgi:hypothetical protein
MPIVNKSLVAAAAALALAVVFLTVTAPLAAAAQPVGDAFYTFKDDVSEVVLQTSYDGSHLRIYTAHTLVLCVGAEPGFEYKSLWRSPSYPITDGAFTGRVESSKGDPAVELKGTFTAPRTATGSVLISYTKYSFDPFSQPALSYCQKEIEFSANAPAPVAPVAPKPEQVVVPFKHRSMAFAAKQGMASVRLPVEEPGVNVQQRLWVPATVARTLGLRVNAGQKRVVIGSGAVTTTQAGPAIVAIRYTKAARTALLRTRLIGLKVRGTTTLSKEGESSVVHSTFAFRR